MLRAMATASAFRMFEPRRPRADGTIVRAWFRFRPASRKSSSCIIRDGAGKAFYNAAGELTKLELVEAVSRMTLEDAAGRDKAALRFILREIPDDLLIGRRGWP